jgi:hypothetical protein
MSCASEVQLTLTNKLTKLSIVSQYASCECFMKYLETQHYVS